jgi:hypothetical protein
MDSKSAGSEPGLVNRAAVPCNDQVILLSPQEFVAATDGGKFNGRFSAIAAELDPQFLGQVVAIMLSCTPR